MEEWMIIGTTGQLPTILLISAIGIVIAVMMIVIKQDRYKYLFGSLVALSAGVWICYKIYCNIELNGLSGGVIGMVLMALFAFGAAIGLFMNRNDGF